MAKKDLLLLQNLIFLVVFFKIFQAKELKNARYGPPAPLYMMLGVPAFFDVR